MENFTQRKRSEIEQLEDLVKAENDDIEKEKEFICMKKKMILCFGGSFNPVHRNHIDVMLKAKEWLENNTSFEVVEGIFVVSSEGYVKHKLRKSPGRVIKGEHRLELCRLACEEHSWLKVHPNLCLSAAQIGKPYGDRGIYVGIIKGGDKIRAKMNWRNIKKNCDPMRVDIVIGRGEDILDVHKQFEDDNEKGLVENKQFFIVPESVGDLSSTKMREFLGRNQGDLENEEARNELELFISKEGADYIVKHFDNLFIE